MALELNKSILSSGGAATAKRGAYVMDPSHPQVTDSYCIASHAPPFANIAKTGGWCARETSLAKPGDGTTGKQTAAQTLTSAKDEITNNTELFL